VGTCCHKQHLTGVDNTLTGDKMSFYLLALLDPLKPVKLK